MNGLDIPLVMIIGWSGSGKTTLLERLIRMLSDRGYRLATVKHHSHAGFEVDLPGKDSFRFARAGSRQVVIASPDKLAMVRMLDHELSLDEIAECIRDVDLVLVEGFKHADHPSIEVLRSSHNRELIAAAAQRIALVSDLPLDLGIPRFDLDDVDGVANFLEERFLAKGKP